MNGRGLRREPWETPCDKGPVEEDFSKRSRPPPVVLSKGEQVEYVQSFKYLGVVIDNTFTEHSDKANRGKLNQLLATSGDCYHVNLEKQKNS